MTNKPNTDLEEKKETCPSCGLVLAVSPSEDCYYCFNAECELYGKHLREEINPSRVPEKEEKRGDFVFTTKTIK